MLSTLKERTTRRMLATQEEKGKATGKAKGKSTKKAKVEQSKKARRKCKSIAGREHKYNRRKAKVSERRTKEEQ